MRSEDLPWRHSLAATLLLLSPFDLLASLGMDMYLPVVPSMADALDAGPIAIQATLTAYLVLIGAGQLLFGPLSDRVGRRPVLLGGGIAYLAASAALACAASPAVFLGFRVVQACGASACLVATFATVRDVYAGRKEGDVVYGLLGSLLATVPALGPLLGTLVHAALGWRAIFGALAVLMACATLAAWRSWPETRRRRAGPHAPWSQLALPMTRLHFWQYTLCYSAGMGSFFVFFSTAPWLLMGRLGVAPIRFSLWFASVAVVMMATARLAGRCAPRWGTRGQLRIAMACLASGGAWLAIDALWVPSSVLGFVAPMWLVGVGIALAVSVAPNGALRGFDRIAGAATAVYFCLGGLLLGLAGNVAIALLPRASHWPVAAYCLVVPIGVWGLSYLGSRTPGEETGIKGSGDRR